MRATVRRLGIRGGRTTPMKAVRWSGVALLVAVSLLVVQGSVAAGGPPSPDHPAGAILGVVPVHGQAGHAGGAGSLTYHGGPVMHTNKVYAIYWVPSGFTVSSGYQSIINGFFQNVAADSGKTSNVYWSDTQYSDGAGAIASSSSWGGSYVDTSALPANGCSDS